MRDQCDDGRNGNKVICVEMCWLVKSGSPGMERNQSQCWWWAWSKLGRKVLYCMPCKQRQAALNISSVCTPALCCALLSHGKVQRTGTDLKHFTYQGYYTSITCRHPDRNEQTPFGNTYNCTYYIPPACLVCLLNHRKLQCQRLPCYLLSVRTCGNVTNLPHYTSTLQPQKCRR